MKLLGNTASEIAEKAGSIGLILSLSGPSMDAINEMSIGEQKSALKAFGTGVFETALGEVITKSKAGQMYDALGKPGYDKLKEVTGKAIEKK